MKGFMPRRWFVTFAAGSVVIIVLGAAAGLGMFKHRTSTAELDAVLRARIPIGTSSHRVEAFLDSVGVDHGEYLPTERVILATWRRTSIGVVGETAIQARFFFDDKQRLIGYKLDEVNTYM